MIERKAKIIPTMPVILSFSLKIKTPIRMVVNKLSTDQIVPTMASWFFCRMAGSQAKTPKE